MFLLLMFLLIVGVSVVVGDKMIVVDALLVLLSLLVVIGCGEQRTGNHRLLEGRYCSENCVAGLLGIEQINANI